MTLLANGGPSLVFVGISLVALLTIFAAGFMGARAGYGYADLEQVPRPPPHGHDMRPGPGPGRFREPSPVDTEALAAVLAAPHLQFCYNIGEHERHVFSQQGEDGVLEYIFDNIGTTDKYYVEFGTEACTECNTRHLWDAYGWTGLLMDGSGKAPDSRIIQNHMITVENIVELFEKYEVPKRFDLLSVDIDTVDYFVTKKILDSGYRPRVIASEINPYFDIEDRLSVPPSHTKWLGTPVFGQSPRAVFEQMEKYGYRTVYTDRNSINVFSIHIDVLVELVHKRTSLTVSHDIIAQLLPPFEYLYRRRAALHGMTHKEFNDMKKSKFMEVHP
ncbi:hypothetical protein M427DRAFT_51207 [Gonapodya prolifera JEL478]|uniref:Methyltransferase FkbM domain-containing protein n=1 Tax=Gonapodya prolifera (strain JEL478) TaxID=1344416 RepID=A0A139AYQ4_GONPJ|nr:hypothetical protein M427DRAFT_51207 [Gonapodya prolifera JEL478]|eukprot:KXS21834.1 hypothetical protein M427DRAFT_51207 [Gonapodya prolifera JEL478]